MFLQCINSKQLFRFRRTRDPSSCRIVVWTEAAEEDELVAAGDDIDRVDLQAAEVADDGKNAVRAGLRLSAREALSRDGEAAGGLER